MTKVRHVLGISGGKDSAALAIYLKNKYPSLDLEYYCCDTGKELDETYQLIENLEVYLGKKIIRLEAASGSHKDPFDHFYEVFGGYLPSSQARWCTKKLKLEPFEDFVGDDPVISYVGIRGDENREGYISKKPNIQSIFPFRQNIWSEDVISKFLANSNIANVEEAYNKLASNQHNNRILEIANTPLSSSLTRDQKLKYLLDLNTVAFNEAIYQWLQSTSYPLASEKEFPLVDNDDILVKKDIFELLRNSGVGVPKYYEELEFEINGKKGTYARSRSGCFFCFFQQKIEWVWLYEQHPDRFKKAMEYEKEGYTWMQDERLEDLAKPERIISIKEEYLKRLHNEGDSSPYLLDKLKDEGDGCAACFI
jgi:3'-phosphoadenosine 5'-phosphosulfate sulfotransferase (PAPS reductase)/FAD synthetase